MIYDWNIASINLHDTSTWLPLNALLSDLVIYKVLKSGISLRDRDNFWPKIFQTGRHIIMDRLNMGTAADVVAKGPLKDMSSIEVCTSCTAISVPNRTKRHEESSKDGTEDGSDVRQGAPRPLINLKKSCRLVGVMLPVYSGEEESQWRLRSAPGHPVLRSPLPSLPLPCPC